MTRYPPAWFLSKPLLPPATHPRGRHLFSSRLLAPFVTESQPRRPSTCNFQFLLSFPPDALPRPPKPYTSRLAWEKFILRRSSPRPSFRLNSSSSVNHFELVRAAGLHIRVFRSQEPLRTRRRSSSWIVGTRVVSLALRAQLVRLAALEALPIQLSKAHYQSQSISPIGFHSKPYAKTHSSPQ